MELVESQSVMQRFFYRYIQEPFLKIKERWLAYFARFAMDDEPSASDVETEIQSSESLPPKKERTRSIKPKVEGQSQLNFGRLAFISTALGATLGLGHLWRFPNLAYRYGGGAFLIIYTLSTLLFGYALYFMEVAIGQYSSKGTLRVFERVPLLEGVGYSIIAYGYVLSTYYTQVASFGMYYFTSSFDSTLPWTSCPQKETDANETMCFTVKYPAHPHYMDLRCSSSVYTIDIELFCTDYQYSDKVKNYCCPNGTDCKEIDRRIICRIREQPAAYYWTANLVRQHPRNDTHRETLGPLDLKHLLCTFGASLSVYVLVSAGIKWTGVITMIILPFMLVAFLLMISVTVNLKGAVNGILHFFVPKLTDFYNHEIWCAALSQAFFSLGIAMGPSFTAGSLSKFRNPCHIDTLLVCISVVLTSVLSGTVVFSMAGYMSEYTAIIWNDSVSNGSGTSIIAYTDILAKFPLPWLSTAIFFFLFTFMTTNSLSCVVISTSASIGELSKVLRQDRYVVNFLLVFSSFLLNIPLIMREGINIFHLLDNFTMRIALPIICLFEILTFLVYGLHLLCEDITFMIGSYPSRFFKYSLILCPFMIVGALVYKFLHPGIQHMRHWTITTELIISGLILCPIVFFMIVNFLKYSVSKNPKQMFRSPAYSGPSSEELQLLRMEFKMRRTIF